MDDFRIHEFPPSFCSVASVSKPSPEPSKAIHSGGGTYYSPGLPTMGKHQAFRRYFNFTYMACQDSILLFSVQPEAAPANEKLKKEDLAEVYKALSHGQTENLGLISGFRLAKKCISERVDATELNITSRQHSRFEFLTWLVGYEGFVVADDGGSETISNYLPHDLGLASATYSFSVTTFFMPDLAPPTLVDVDVVEITEESFTVLLSADEACIVSYLVLLEGKATNA